MAELRWTGLLPLLVESLRRDQHTNAIVLIVVLIAVCAACWYLVARPALSYRIFGRLDPEYHRIVSGDSDFEGRLYPPITRFLTLFSAILVTLSLAVAVGKLVS